MTVDGIAKAVLALDDGWRWVNDYDAGGGHVRLLLTNPYKAEDDCTEVEIEVKQHGTSVYAFVRTMHKLPRGPWETVSTSFHNPRIRNAIELVNASIDARGEAGVQTSPTNT